MALVERILNPNTREVGFRELVVTYQKRLYWLIRGIVGSHDDADDVVQNTFLKIARHMRSYKGEAALLTWMYKIAVNESATFLAASNQFRRAMQTASPATALSSSTDLTEEGIVAFLEKSIQSLPEKQRIVFCLRYFDGMPYEQMATMTGTSVGALKASYHHAVKKIEEAISNGKYTD